MELKNNVNPSPIVHLEVENTSDKPAKAQLFNVTKNLMSSNFGNDKSISVKTKENRSFVSYHQMLLSTLNEFLTIQRLEIRCDNYDDLENVRVMYSETDPIEGLYVMKEIDMKRLVNERKKFNKETDFEPFCPVVIEEDMDFTINYKRGIELILPPNTKFDFNFVISERTLYDQTKRVSFTKEETSFKTKIKLQNTTQNSFYTLSCRDLLQNFKKITPKIPSGVNPDDLIIDIDNIDNHKRLFKLNEEKNLYLGHIRFVKLKGEFPQSISLRENMQEGEREIYKCPILPSPYGINLQTCDNLIHTSFHDSSEVNIIGIEPQSEIEVTFYFELLNK